MNETDYNARLYEKMKAEQDKYRDWLLHQEPSEILNHTYECHKAKQRTLFDNFQFVASLWTASAVLYFCIAWLYSFFSDGLVDINLYSLVFRGKEFVKGTMLPAQRISPQSAGTLVT